MSPRYKIKGRALKKARVVLQKKANERKANEDVEQVASTSGAGDGDGNSDITKHKSKIFL